jgi:hypothetical protein
MGGYALMAAPTLYPGQVVYGRISADPLNQQPVHARIYIHIYGDEDIPERVYGPMRLLRPGSDWQFEWKIPDTAGASIFEIGVEITSTTRSDGSVYLDFLSWLGEPEVEFSQAQPGTMGQRAWVDGVSTLWFHRPEYMRLVQNEGRGMVMTGTRVWRNYTVEADLTPHMLEKMGLAARVQGLRRYISLELSRDGKARLIKQWDGTAQLLAEGNYPLEFGRRYRLKLETREDQVTALIDDKLALRASIDILNGGLGLICEVGRLGVERVLVKPSTG